MNHVETVQAIYEAFGRGDIPAILDFHCIDRHAGVLAYEP